MYRYVPNPLLAEMVLSWVSLRYSYTRFVKIILLLSLPTDSEAIYGSTSSMLFIHEHRQCWLDIPQLSLLASSLAELSCHRHSLDRFHSRAAVSFPWPANVVSDQ